MSYEAASQATAAASLDVNIDKQRLGAVYAKALLGATEPRQASETVVSELDSLVDDVLQQFPEFEIALASPRVLPNEKIQLIDRVLGGRASDTLLDFLKVVARHGRLDCIRHIRSAARAEFNRLRNRLSVQVTTAEPLSHPLRERIVYQLQTRFGREIDLECRVDAEILGGLVVRIGDTIYDSSIANELDRLKQETLEKTITQIRESTDRFALTS